MWPDLRLRSGGLGGGPGRHSLLLYLSNIALHLLFGTSRSIDVISKLERHAEQLCALGHPVRLKVLRFVVQAGDEGAPAGDIQKHVKLAASTLSHHLKRMVDAGLLTTRGEGTFHYYAVDYGALQALTEYLWEDCCKRGPSRSPKCC